jgi:hypothetical protein
VLEDTVRIARWMKRDVTRRVQYFVPASDRLYTLDVVSRMAAVVCELDQVVRNIAWCGSHLYGVRIKGTASSLLVKFDRERGRASVVGEIGYKIVGLSSLRGRLYGSSESQLVRIDLDTGAGQVADLIHVIVQIVNVKRLVRSCVSSWHPQSTTYSKRTKAALTQRLFVLCQSSFSNRRQPR